MTQTPRTAEFYAKLYDERVPQELVDAVSKDERQWAEKLELETIDLTRQLAERDRQLAEAKRDAERLDWLQENHFYNGGYGENNRSYSWTFYTPNNDKQYEPIRNKIDQAIQEQKK